MSEENWCTVKGLRKIVADRTKTSWRWGTNGDDAITFLLDRNDELTVALKARAVSGCPDRYYCGMCDQHLSGYERNSLRGHAQDCLLNEENEK